MENKKYKKSTGIIIKNNLGEVLFLKRKSNGLWTLPGGKTEEGETSLECAKRELEEEAGIKEIELEFYSHTTSLTNGTHWKETTYIGYSDNAQNLEKHIFSEMQYFNINKLPSIDTIEPYDHGLIEMLKGNQKTNKSFDNLI